MDDSGPARNRNGYAVEDEGQQSMVGRVEAQRTCMR